MRKNARMTIAATSAPISGRASSRLDTPRRTRWEGSAGVAAAGAWTFWVMRGTPIAEAPGPPDEIRRPGGEGSARVVLRERKDLGDVGLVDERRTGEHGLAATEVVAVLQVEVERGHGHVALHVRLLVDGELDLAVLDVLRDLFVQVEGDDLGLAAGRGDRLERVERLRGAQRHDVVDRLVLRELGLQGRRDGRVVGPVDLDVLGAGDRGLDARAARFEGDRAGLLDH